MSCHHAAQAQGYAASAVVLVAEPKVKEEIDTRVVVFRDSALQALPQQVRPLGCCVLGADALLRSALRQCSWKQP
jgi:hypothetical protein